MGVTLLIIINTETKCYKTLHYGEVPEGWIAVPVRLELRARAYCPYCELQIKDGILTDIIRLERPEPEPDYSEQITELKEQLASTDYKIIKCSEASLIGEELPYDVAELHAERQALRDQINELEAKLSEEVNTNG